MRQWVLAVLKRLRYFLQRDAALQCTVLRIFLSVLERCLREHSPACPVTARIWEVNGRCTSASRRSSSKSRNIALA